MNHLPRYIVYNTKGVDEMPLVATLTIVQEDANSPTRITCSYNPTVEELQIDEAENVPDSYFLMSVAYAKLTDYLESLRKKGAIETIQDINVSDAPKSVN